MSDRKKMIQQGFDTVAQGYDHPSLSFFPETAKRLVRYLNLQPKNVLLDVCTGTGVVALEAAKQLSGGKVKAIDLSSGMLQQAKDKSVLSNLINVEFMQMDVDELNFEKEYFDVATSSFGLFFLEDMRKGLQNISDVVKPGGRIAISSFTGDAFSPMADIFIKRYEATGRVVPALSWRRLATNEQIETLFNSVGISKVEIHHQPLGCQMTSADMWWDVIWNTGWRALLNQLSEDELRLFKQQHLQEITELLGDKGVWFNTEVLIAVGEKA